VRVDYSDGVTPSVNFAWDRQGRRTGAGDANAMFDYHYNAAGLLESEQCVSGLLAGMNVTNGYDVLLRRTNLTTISQSGMLYHVGYGYDAASRLNVVESGGNTAEYSYLANSPLVEQIQFKNGGMVRMTTTKTYDLVNRLTSISSAPSAPSASSVVSFKYQMNSASQRTAITNADGSHWRYGYDSLGQVTSGNKHWADGSSVAGQQFGYQFDDIGNRKSASVAGGESGLTRRDLGYTANVLNQYEKRDISRWIPQSGTANALSTVTLNDQHTVRQGEYYWGELYAENSAAPAWVGITNLGVLNDGTNPDVVTGYEGHKYAPKTPEAFTHDDDGNLTTDGRWTYTWDAADRLVGISILSTINSQQSTFFYDGLGRRVQMLETTNGVTASDKRFVWVSTELAEERDATGALVTKRFFGQGEQQWSMIDNQPVCQNFYYTRDHLGSVREMTDVGGVVRARYEYDPYGVRSKVSGDLDADFGFTGHYYHAPSDLHLALYRAYDAGTGRWLSRDPIAEKGGLNLYAYCGNNPINGVDPLGLSAGSAAWAFLKGAVSTVVVGGAIALALTASSPIIIAGGLAAAMSAAVYGGYQLGKGIYELATRTDSATGETISEDEALDRAAGMLGGLSVGVGVLGYGRVMKWINQSKPCPPAVRQK
jgi:RHS repeat-associated protein